MTEFRTFSLNLSKIPKDKIWRNKKGDAMINLIMWDNDAQDQYGNDFSVQYNRTQEERDANAPAVYVGNGKIHGRQLPTPEDYDDAIEVEPVDDELPF